MKDYIRTVRYLRPYKRLIAVSIISSVLVAVLFAGSLAGAKPALDVLFDEFDIETYRKFPLMDTELGNSLLLSFQSLLLKDRFKLLVVVSGMIFVLAILRSFLGFIHGYIGAYLANRIRIDIVTELHDKILDQSLSFFSKEGVATAISVLGADAALIHRGALILFDKIMMEPLNIIAGLTVAFILNPKLATLAVLGFPLMGYTVNRFGKKIKKNTLKGLIIGGGILSLLQESLFGIKIIKSFVMENYERARFHDANIRLLKVSMRAVKARKLVSPIINSVAALGLASFVLLGGRDVLSGEMDTSSFFTFYLALGAVFGPLRKLSKTVGEVQTSLAGAIRTFDFMDRMPEVHDCSDAGEMPRIKGAVEFDNISFSYDGETEVIHDLSLDVEPGETVAFVGPSGAGKTTMINLLLRFYDVTKGAIRIDGVDIRSVTQASLRSQIGLVTQENILFNDTVAGNINFGRSDFSRDDIVRAAKAGRLLSSRIASPRS